MVSSIGWIDRDSEARQRSLQLISLFNAPESRDELGIGGVRDAIADILFPGTIQACHAMVGWMGSLHPLNRRPPSPSWGFSCVPHSSI